MNKLVRFFLHLLVIIGWGYLIYSFVFIFRNEFDGSLGETLEQYVFKFDYEKEAEEFSGHRIDVYNIYQRLSYFLFCALYFKITFLIGIFFINVGESLLNSSIDKVQPMMDSLLSDDE